MVELEYKSGSAAWSLTIRTQCSPARGPNHNVWYKLQIGIDVSQQFKERKLRQRRRRRWKGGGGEMGETKEEGGREGGGRETG